MTDKYGTYILKLMTVIMDTDQENFIRKLSWDELKKMNDDLSSFLMNKEKLLTERKTLAEAHRKKIIL